MFCNIELTCFLVCVIRDAWHHQNLHNLMLDQGFRLRVPSSLLRLFIHLQVVVTFPKSLLGLDSSWLAISVRIDGTLWNHELVVDIYCSVCHLSCNSAFLIGGITTTGATTFHIDGITLHSAIKLPVQAHNNNELSGAAHLQQRLQNISYIISDEISMLGQKGMEWTDRSRWGKWHPIFHDPCRWLYPTPTCACLSTVAPMSSECSLGGSVPSPCLSTPPKRVQTNNYSPQGQKLQRGWHIKLR